MNLAGHSVWVIGCGFLGSALAECCREAGARVLTLDPCAVANIRGSAAEAPVLQHALERLVPDIVFCCAATRGGDAAAYRRAYLQPVQHLGALLRGCRVVFCSSVSVYAGRGGEVVTEESPAQAATERAQILLQAEAAVQAQGGVVARLAPLYGPGRCELLRRYMQGLPGLPGAPERRLNYLHCDDAVSALLLLGTQPWLLHGVYNVSGESFTKHRIYELLEAGFGIESVAEAPAPSLRGISDMRVDCTRLHQLGWRPRWNMLAFAHEWKGDTP